MSFSLSVATPYKRKLEEISTQAETKITSASEQSRKDYYSNITKEENVRRSIAAEIA